MPCRMICTDCFHVGEPETVLAGSDRLEILGWCLFALPGLIYCWWRHAGRSKICAACGGGALMRESRAAAARRGPVASSGSGRFHSDHGAFLWPGTLVSPRVRLRSGSVAAALSLVAAVAWILGLLEPGPSTTAQVVARGGWLLCAGWIAFQAALLVRERSFAAGCRAWDEQGRPLRLERL